MCMATLLWFKSCEDHSLLKSYNGGLWYRIYRSGPINVYLNYSKYLAILIIIITLICRPAIKHMHSNLEYNKDRISICPSFEKNVFCMSLY